MQRERKTIEWERLEISSRKLEIPREHFLQRWVQERTETVWTLQKQKIRFFLYSSVYSVKKMWQEYTELYKKNLNDPDNYDGVITHLEPDILECKVMWALGSITMNKASGGDGIPVQLFQILRHDVVKVLHSMCHQIWKTQQWSQDWKMSVFISISKKAM